MIGRITDRNIYSISSRVRSSSSSLAKIPKEHKTNICAVVVYLELPSELSIPNYFIKLSMWFDLHTKTIVKYLVCSNIWVFKNRCCASAHWPIEFLFFNYNLYLTTSHFSYIWKDYIYVLILTFCPLSDIILDESIRILKLCFQFMDLCTRYIDPLGEYIS
jgi:hypothetical protein